MQTLTATVTFDAIVGTRINVRYFENTGTTSAPVFTERLGNDNPLISSISA